MLIKLTNIAEKRSLRLGGTLLLHPGGSEYVTSLTPGMQKMSDRGLLEIEYIGASTTLGELELAFNNLLSKLDDDGGVGETDYDENLAV